MDIVSQECLFQSANSSIKQTQKGINMVLPATMRLPEIIENAPAEPKIIDEHNSRLLTRQKYEKYMRCFPVSDLYNFETGMTRR